MQWFTIIALLTLYGSLGTHAGPVEDLQAAQQSALDALENNQATRMQELTFNHLLKKEQLERKGRRDLSNLDSLFLDKLFALIDRHIEQIFKLRWDQLKEFRERSDDTNVAQMQNRHKQQIRQQEARHVVQHRQRDHQERQQTQQLKNVIKQNKQQLDNFQRNKKQQLINYQRNQVQQMKNRHRQQIQKLQNELAKEEDD